jgi:RNA polymerase sigma factor (sigma-70 family)
LNDIERLYREIRTPSVKMMSRILGGDWHGGEDVVQEAFTRALRFYPSFDPEKGKIKAWFNGIMFNALRDYQRDSRFGPQSEAEDFSVEDMVGELSVSNFEEKREYLSYEIARTKNPQHREVLHLFFMLGYTSNEITQIVSKMTQTNVTTIVTRFKEKILRAKQ